MNIKWKKGRFCINKKSFSVTEAADLRANLPKIEDTINHVLKSREEIAKLCNDPQQDKNN